MPGGNILHFNSIRVRAVGNGNLIGTFQGFDNIEQQELVAMPMSETNRRELFRLGNFIGPACKLRLETRDFDDFMKVNNITIYAKYYASEDPA